MEQKIVIVALHVKNIPMADHIDAALGINGKNGCVLGLQILPDGGENLCQFRIF